ncbi:MAG: hypothetical protein KQH79_01000 [Bacteroidetes bacterium]|nr:hypothetical protein [Bacteroidota bacterium]
MNNNKLEYLLSKVKLLKEKEISFGIEKKNDLYYLKIVSHIDFNSSEEAHEVINIFQSLFKAT